MYLLHSHNYIKPNNEKYNKSAVELLGYIFSAIIQHYLFAALCFKYVSTFIVHISWRALCFVHLSCFHHDTPGEQLSPPPTPCKTCSLTGAYLQSPSNNWRHILALFSLSAKYCEMIYLFVAYFADCVYKFVWWMSSSLWQYPSTKKLVTLASIYFFNTY